MTSLEKELSRTIPVSQVEEHIAHAFAAHFNYLEIHNVLPDVVKAE